MELGDIFSRAQHLDALLYLVAQSPDLPSVLKNQAPGSSAPISGKDSPAPGHTWSKGGAESALPAPMPDFAYTAPTEQIFAAAQGERVSMGVSSQHFSAEALFREHGKYVARLLWRMGLADEDIDDGVQDVFMVAHRRGGFVAGVAKPTTWLAEIAVRVARARRRRISFRRTEPQEAAIAALVAPGPNPDEAAAHAQSLARVQQALNSLDVDRRAVFVLADILGESCEDIARSLGIAVGTVYSRLSRARDKFRKAYERLNREGNA